MDAQDGGYTLSSAKMLTIEYISRNIVLATGDSFFNGFVHRKTLENAISLCSSSLYIYKLTD